MTPKKFVILAMCIIVPLAIGFVGSYFTMPSIPGWYQGLAKPFIAPPNWVFGPVWTSLYILMGIASFLVFQKGINKKNIYALKIYVLQLLLNLLWSIAFFGFQSLIGGLIIIILLWIIIFINIKAFSKINNTAGYLLWPYIAWVSFASLLNLLILLLNPQ